MTECRGWWVGITCWWRVSCCVNLECERRANISELSNIQQAVQKERPVRSVHTEWRRRHAVQQRALHNCTDTRTGCSRCPFFLSIPGRGVSSLLTLTTRVSGLWGLVQTGPSRLHQTGTVRLGSPHQNHGQQGRSQTTPKEGKGHCEVRRRGGVLGPTGFIQYEATERGTRVCTQSLRARWCLQRLYEL